MCKTDNKFLCLFRLFFGSWLLFVGVMKWIGPGPSGFVKYIEGTFATTWAAGPLVTVLAWLILVAEPLIGALLILKGNKKGPWMMASLLMFMLVLGQSILQNYAVVANNWFYLFICLVGVGMAEDCCASKGSCSADAGSKPNQGGSCSTEKGHCH